MSLVSLDTIVQADATLIVGVVFILTLKQALHQEVTRDDRRFVAGAILSYLFSGIAAAFPDAVSSLGVALGISDKLAYTDWTARTFTFGSYFLFYLGMALTVGAVWWMMRRTKTSERNKTK